ncbi:MAG: hypothetical protein NTZ59_11640 [Bacteroidetes bacterium]|nr:hypothetical protein [Bacteroidota bacterium]
MSRLNPTNKSLRDNHIRELFRTVKKKNPKWDIYYVIDEVAGKVFLSTATVAKILKQDNTPIPSHVTVIERTKKMAEYAKTA